MNEKSVENGRLLPAFKKILGFDALVFDRGDTDRRLHCSPSPPGTVIQLANELGVLHYDVVSLLRSTCAFAALGFRGGVSPVRIAH